MITDDGESDRDAFGDIGVPTGDFGDFDLSGVEGGDSDATGLSTGGFTGGDFTFLCEDCFVWYC